MHQNRLQCRRNLFFFEVELTEDPTFSSFAVSSDSGLRGPRLPLIIYFPMASAMIISPMERRTHEEIYLYNQQILKELSYVYEKIPRTGERIKFIIYLRFFCGGSLCSFVIVRWYVKYVDNVVKSTIYLCLINWLISVRTRQVCNRFEFDS